MKRNPLQEIHHRTTQKLMKFASDYAKKVIQTKSFSDRTWETETKKITLGGILEAVGLGIKEVFKMKAPSDVSNYFLNAPYNGHTLSTRLRESAEKARVMVDNVIREHAKNKSNWKSIAKELDRLKISKGDIPKYITKIEKGAKTLLPDSKEMKKLLADARRKAEQLKTPQLKSAYEKVVKAVESNSPAKLAEALNNAVAKKAIYNNERIARTETARAWNDAFMRRIIDDKDITAVKYSLSMGHPVRDYCDFYAEADAYGLGRGVYPKEACPQIPTHANCLCTLDAVSLADLKGVKFDERRAREQLETLGIPKSQQKIILEGKANGNGLRGGSLKDAKPLPRELLDRV